MISLGQIIDRGDVKLLKRSYLDHLQSFLITFGRPIGGVSLGSFKRWHATVLSLLYASSLLIAFVVMWSQTAILQSKLDIITLSPTADLVCVEVPVVLDADYTATYSGFWNTDYKNFKSNESAFVLALRGASYTELEYKQTMQSIAAELRGYGNFSRTQNVLGTMIIWSTYTLKRPNLHFYSTADPGYIFNAQLSQAVMSSARGVCDPVKALTVKTRAQSVARPLSATFDTALKTLTLRIPVLKVAAAGASVLTMFQPCPNQGNWTDRSDKNRFTNSVAQFADLKADLTFDVRTALLAISLNTQSGATPEALVETNSKLADEFGFTAYIDPSIEPSMDPVYCLNKDKAWSEYGIRLFENQTVKGSPPICVMADSFRTRTVFFFYPFIIQVKSDANTMFPWNFTRQTPCSCLKDSEDFECNSAQNFYFNFFYNMNFSRIATVDFAQKMQLAYINAGGKNGGAIGLQNSLFQLLTLSSIFKSNEDYKVSYRNDVPLTSFKKDGVFYDNSWANDITGQPRSIRQIIRDEFMRICDGTCATIIFQLQRMIGRTDLEFSMNGLNLQLGYLVPEPIQYFNFSTMKASGSQAELARAFSRIKLPYTMCRDTVSQAKVFEKLSQRPPVPLKEEFRRCKKPLIFALRDSVGGTFSASVLYVSSAWVIFGFVFIRLWRSMLPKGAILPSSTELESIRQAEAVLEREKMVLVLESLKRYVDGNGSGSDVHRQIDSLTTIYRAVIDSSDQHNVEIAGREISEKLHGLPTSMPNPPPVRRITLSLPPQESAFPQRRSSFAAKRPSLSAHPLEMVLSNTRLPPRSSISTNKPLPPNFN